jgi:hypothetical protein
MGLVEDFDEGFSYGVAMRLRALPEQSVNGNGATAARQGRGIVFS